MFPRMRLEVTADNDGGLVTVFGGSGFLGRHVVRALARAGYRVRVAVRRPDLAGHLQPLGGVGQIHAVQANLRYPESVAAAVVGSDAVVNLTGILYESGHQSFEAVQAFGAGVVAEAAAEAGVSHLVHVSAIGADSGSQANYARTKAEGEENVVDAFPSAVILRPSVIFGQGDDFFNRFAAMARISPVLPLIGGGHTKFQPVFASDVADTVVAGVSGRAATGTVYELGGPQTLSFREILEFILEETGRRCVLVPVPFSFMRFEAWFLQLMPKPLLTVDQVTLLETDNVVSEAASTEGRTLQGLDIPPHSIDAIVPVYLERFRRAGQFERNRVAGNGV